jgi:protein phosphatase
LLTNLSEAHALPRQAEIGYSMVVADGMGGAAGGEIASRCAIQDLVHLVLNTPDWILNAESPWVEEAMRRMAERFREISRFINQRAAADPRLQGMGTTMTLACSLGLELVLCHIGDSRAYLFRQDAVRQLTRDMTMAQELIQAGMLNPAQSAAHRFRHVLTQCLGASGTATAEVRHLTLRDDDQLLLCSDGLYDMVDDGLIADTLRGAASPKSACQALVDRALEAGGKDNITVVVAHFSHDRWLDMI